MAVYWWVEFACTFDKELCTKCSFINTFFAFDDWL